MVLGFQKVPPEEAARVQERLRQSEQNLDAAKARLQRSWDNSPLNPVQR
jgi:tripartite-type tricarboxylate transporter receptor subunit TctC